MFEVKVQRFNVHSVSNYTTMNESKPGFKSVFADWESHELDRKSKDTLFFFFLNLVIMPFMHLPNALSVTYCFLEVLQGILS